MIVDPDFPDHWKTRLLVNSLNDEAAPVYVLRIWAHCQNRRQSQFESLTSEALKALCRFPGPANKLESSLTASGFIRRDGNELIVCNWDEYNSSLLAAWENGRKGGRPKKNPNPIPKETHGLPVGNPDVTDKRREEKRSIPPNPQGLKNWGQLKIPEKLNTDRFRSALERWALVLVDKGNYSIHSVQSVIDAFYDHGERKSYAYLRAWASSGRFTPLWTDCYEAYLPDDDQPQTAAVERTYAPKPPIAVKAVMS